MIVKSSAVNMSSKTSQTRSYKQTKKTLSTNLATGEMTYSQDTFAGSYEQTMEESLSDGIEDSKCKLSRKEKTNDDKATEVTSKNPKDLYDNKIANVFYNVPSTNRSISSQLRLFLLELRNRISLFIGRTNFHYSLGRLDEIYQGNNVIDLSSGGSYQLWHRKTYETISYEEKETLSFSTTGKVVTGDGRELNFNMELNMTHGFSAELENFSSCIDAVMTDPLVLSIDDNPISVSDQKWSFDIDGDGKLDEISMLSKGACYLAYDRNGDGIINDGKELFGARTGNGFRELAEFDEDGNGWIDEADSIYDKLSIWQKDDSFNDVLIDLKKAKIGAIYLGNTKSEYDMKSNEDNTMNAKVKRSGMYLTEEGTAKSIQQLDMVKALIS